MSRDFMTFWETPFPNFSVNEKSGEYDFGKGRGSGLGLSLGGVGSIGSVAHWRSSGVAIRRLGSCPGFKLDQGAFSPIVGLDVFMCKMTRLGKSFSLITPRNKMWSFSHMLGSLSAALYFSVIVSCSYQGLHATALVTVIVTLSQQKRALEVSHQREEGL